MTLFYHERVQLRRLYPESPSNDPEFRFCKWAEKVPAYELEEYIRWCECRIRWTKKRTVLLRRLIHPALACVTHLLYNVGLYEAQEAVTEAAVWFCCLGKPPEDLGRTTDYDTVWGIYPMYDQEQYLVSDKFLSEHVHGTLRD